MNYTASGSIFSDYLKPLWIVVYLLLKVSKKLSITRVLIKT